RAKKPQPRNTAELALPGRRCCPLEGGSAACAAGGSQVVNVSAWSIRNPIPAAMLFVMLTLAGLFAFQQMKVQNFPDLDLPTITVVAALPGASPNQLENDVARIIENSLASLQGLKHIYTKVQDGTVSLTVEFRIEKNTQEALDDVRSAVAK